MKGKKGFLEVNRILRCLLIFASLLAIALLAAACAPSTEKSPQPTVTPATTLPSLLPVEIPLNQNLRFEHLTTADGLPESRVWGITQDSKGFMWFTSWEGLSRYDGYEFKVFRQERERQNSPGGSGFFVVMEDKKGMIWAGSQTGGGLSRYNPSTEQWTRFQNDPDDPNSLSSNNVYAIIEDSNGILWVGTEGGGLNRFEGETEDGQGRFTRFQPDPGDPHSLGADFAVSIYEDRSGTLWIGTFGGGLNRFNPQTETFTRYLHDPENPDSLSHNLVKAIFEDRSGEFWIGTYGGGLNRFDRESETFSHYHHNPEDQSSLSGNTVVDILEDQAGSLWIATFDGGLNRYNPEQDNFSSYQHDPIDPRSLGSDSLASLFVDHSGILWVGTAGSGISKLDPRQQGFSLFRHDPTDANSLSNNDVRSIYEDRLGDLWIGTFGGLNRFDPETGRITRYLHDPNDPTSLSDDHVFAFAEDNTGALWIGVDTYGLNRFDYDTETFTHFKPDQADPHSISDGVVTQLYFDRGGTLWIGTFSAGLNAIDPQTLEHGPARFTQYKNDPDDPHSLGAGTIYAILEDHMGVLWVGTFGGLCKFDRQTQTFSCFKHNPDDSGSLSDNTIFAIHEDREGALWIGTSGGLNRLDPETGEFTNFTTVDGLPHDTVSGILEDEDGHLWLSTARGLSQFNPSMDAFRTYVASDGLQGDGFNLRSFHKTSNGELYFGGPNGLTGFNPDDIQDNPHIPPVYITRFRLADRTVDIGGDSPLQTSILSSKDLNLSYNDRVISFEFAALSLNAPDKNRYRYMLEGFEDDWNEVDSSRRFATYTNLDPGDYVFRVIGSNNDGVWNEEGTSINITVTPPWWESWLFRIGMVMLAFGLIAGWYRQRMSGIEQRTRELETQVANRTQELEAAVESAETANQVKSTFLANISHELRTPLNAILGFAQLLVRDEGLNAQQKEMLDVINRSGEHLLGMVDDVLSLSRIEAGRIELKEEAFDVAQLLEDVERLFRSRAAGKDLRFHLQLDEQLQAWLWGDSGKLRQVLINLLGNAVKYTQEGDIWLRAASLPISQDPPRVMLQIEVEDTGPGMPKDELELVFEAFVQAKRAPNGEGGTGLGLSISKSLVELMGGEISVESELGRGTLFKVNVPLKTATAEDAPPSETAVAEVVGLQADQPAWRILVVDDNLENRALLTNLLTTVGFDVREAEDGQQAVMLFKDWRPHFIWMDMRMPVMDGYTATREIRALPGGEAVKIVAVTASALEEQHEEILACGCDDLVCKPFRDQEIFGAMATQLGIKYRYKAGLVVPRKPLEINLTAEMLATLPKELLQELDLTTLTLDREAIFAVIERIDDEDPETAEALRALMDNFQTARIRALLKETERQNGS